jgi:hypothetical protein
MEYNCVALLCFAFRKPLERASELHDAYTYAVRAAFLYPLYFILSLMHLSLASTFISVRAFTYIELIGLLLLIPWTNVLSSRVIRRIICQRGPVKEMRAVSFVV